MPYVNESARASLTDLTDRIEALQLDGPGDANYLITKILNKYLDQYKFNYESLNASIGILECAKMELYRRLGAPYEDKKIIENGDVYSIKFTK